MDQLRPWPVFFLGAVRFRHRQFGRQGIKGAGTLLWVLLKADKKFASFFFGLPGTTGKRSGERGKKKDR